MSLDSDNPVVFAALRRALKVKGVVSAAVVNIEKPRSLDGSSVT